jgi:hypothetical protein
MARHTLVAGLVVLLALACGHVVPEPAAAATTMLPASSAVQDAADPRGGGHDETAGRFVWTTKTMAAAAGGAQHGGVGAAVGDADDAVGGPQRAAKGSMPSRAVVPWLKPVRRFLAGEVGGADSAAKPSCHSNNVHNDCAPPSWH